MIKKLLQNEKMRKTVHTLSGIVAVISFVAVILLSPVGKTLLSSSGNSDNTQTTSPDINSVYDIEEKNYVIFVDERYFYHSETNGVTTIRGKTDRNIKMEITPMKGTSYFALCESTALYAVLSNEIPVLNTTSLCTLYTTTADGFITNVICVDDGYGSSIEIKYTYPENDTQTKETFDIMLSMFKIEEL